ncbi:hypothetical protein ABDD95_20355 [Mucilaginibacter sp. PAMB04274]|uniref:hypothetical protein n=1 Tax=Mucilaginibacter sp. PAMB04274 TaxID=3138568 RepID=UPI0031F6B4EF
MKTGHQRSRPARRNRMIFYLEQTLERRQTQVALYLNRKTQHWNRASKLILLLLICLLFGGGSIWLLIQAYH